MGKKYNLTIGEFLEQTSDRHNVFVFDCDGELMASYDGKNSIPWEYNYIAIDYIAILQTDSGKREYYIMTNEKVVNE